MEFGGTLDTIAGTVKRAPKLWCKLQLEWLYRLIMKPNRIKRQKLLPVFAVMVLMSELKIIMGAGSRMRIKVSSNRQIYKIPAPNIL